MLCKYDPSLTAAVRNSAAPWYWYSWSCGYYRYSLLNYINSLNKVDQQVFFPVKLSNFGFSSHLHVAGKLLNIKDAYLHPLFYKGCDEETGFKTRWLTNKFELRKYYLPIFKLQSSHSNCHAGNLQCFYKSITKNSKHEIYIITNICGKLNYFFKLLPNWWLWRSRPEPNYVLWRSQQK